MSVIICEERLTCRDQNVNRWYCHADAQGDCPLARCAVTQKPDEPHSCESCPTCGVHGGRHDKCCGCYDGVCCQESGDPSS